MKVAAKIEVEYEKFFLVSLDMLCISGYDGHFKKVNPAFERVLGFSAEELCAKSYLEFIHPDDIERTTKEVESQLLTKQEVLSFENRYRCKDGTYRWLSWKSAPVGNYMYAVARDITESKNTNEEVKRSKEALELANRELEEFSHSVAHDLRAPVRAIFGFASMVSEDSTTQLSPTAKDYLARVTGAAKKMGVLVDGLLNLSRLSRAGITHQRYDLSRAVREIATELQRVEPGRKVKFNITPDVIAYGDPVLLRVVIENLINNAWKYTSKRQEDVVIEFGMNGKVFFVRDNGDGFDMKYVDKLFRVFHRLHNDSEFEGTGIGLATVHRIVKRHDGRIWATGAPQKGATFLFTLGELPPAK